MFFITRNRGHCCTHPLWSHVYAAGLTGDERLCQTVCPPQSWLQRNILRPGRLACLPATAGKEPLIGGNKHRTVCLRLRIAREEGLRLLNTSPLSFPVNGGGNIETWALWRRQSDKWSGLSCYGHWAGKYKRASPGHGLTRFQENINPLRKLFMSGA